MVKRRVTSRDVAKRVGVSRTTVSFVLNNVVGSNISKETRRRVLAAAEELGYVPHAAAQALAGQRTRIIGLVFPRSYHHLPTHFFLLQILDGLLDVVQQNGLRLLIDSLGESNGKQSYLNLVRAKRIDGLIVLDPRSDNPALHALAQEGFPLVLIGDLSGADICSVDVDNRTASSVAVKHLLSLGHSRIGCITNAPLAGYRVTEERLLGYRDALDAAGIAFDETLVRYGEYTPESGFSRMNSLLDEARPWPTAVFVASDVVAFGAMAAIQQRGLKIPDDIALVGYDDVPLARFVNPPLTTVRLPASEQGRRAGELLLDLVLKRPRHGRRILLATELIVRASSGGDKS
ncbi:MAG TPA: LacI family DNA-binding transcriptional regulator [Anaerolineae bacterium]